MPLSNWFQVAQWLLSLKSALPDPSPKDCQGPQALGTRLLVAQDLARVEAGGAARGEERGGAADGGEKRRGGGEGERVGGLDAKEDGLHRAGAG